MPTFSCLLSSPAIVLEANRFVSDALRLGPPNLYLSRQHLLIPTCATTTLLSANASVLIRARFSVNADGDGSKKQWHSAWLIY